jgi:hypothetical protein
MLLLAGCAGTPHRPLSTGTEHLDATRAAVVFLSSDCTGVLIAPRTVLTAAHCVLAQDELPTVHVQRGGVRWESRASSCRAHPQAVASAAGEFPACEDIHDASTRSAHDLAVLHLAAEVPSSLAEPIPVLLAPPTEVPDWWRGQRVRLVGWHRRPALVGAARRYSGQNVIASVSGAVLTALPQGSGFSTRIGGSGGPALIALDGREHVLGILFGGERADSADSVYTATFHPDNAAWIVRAAPEAFPADLEAGSEPSPVFHSAHAPE